jgi:hypothetical protein
MMRNKIENAAKACADEKASGENWIELFPNIYLAASRTSKSDEQEKTLRRNLTMPEY